MYEIHADISKNCLFIVLKGFLGDDETKKASDKAMEEGRKLRSGFSIVNDLTEFKPVTEQGAKYMKDAQVFLFKSGAKKVIRIVSSALAKAQFSRVQKEANASYEVAEVQSMEEALKLI